MRFLAPIGILLVSALVLIEVSMQPAASDRLLFLALFGGAAVVTIILSRVLPAMLERVGSVRRSLSIIALIATAVATATVVTSARFMFLSAHDLRVFLAALGLGVGLALVLARILSERMEADMRSLASTAALVAAGDREARTGIERQDEIGMVAGAVDSMIEQLAAGEAARTKLLASLSHDLRTPLAAMQAAVEALQDGVAPDPERYLASVSNDIALMSGLVDDLFLLGRLEAGSIEFETLPVNLAELADEAVEALTPVAAQGGVSIDVTRSGNTNIYGAPRELGRAIRNLLDNALRYSPPRSRVKVQLSNGGPFATLRVIDEGPGFSSEIRDSAFGEFTTADASRSRRHGGAGLGLAITKSIVEAHNGSLWIDDVPGGSVAFKLAVRSG